jgi:biopolymer transport protein ExbD
MAGSTRTAESNTIAEINVIPLVDIILVVLIIFMVAAPLVMKPKIDINLPKAATAQNDTDKARMKVILGKKGELFVDNQAVSLEGLTSEAKKRAIQNPNTGALLIADKESTLEMVTTLVDAIKQGGVQKVAFSIEKK